MQHTHFLQSKKLRLRALELTDVEILYKIENDSEMWDISGFTTPYSRKTLQEFIVATHSDLYVDKQLRLMIEHKETKKIIGIIDLDSFDPHHSRATVGIMIQRDARRAGMAKEALKLLCDYVFNYLHIHQLIAYVPVDNVASLHVFLHAGFRQQARLTDWIRRTEGYCDVFLLQQQGETTDKK